jgi:DNA-binding FrmR family transcriptional regulator
MGSPVPRNASEAGSPRSTDRPTDEWSALQARLGRLEGQAHGIAGMVRADRDTLEVLQQFSALIAASREAALMFATVRLREQLRASAGDVAASEIISHLEPLLGRAVRLP